MRARAWGLRLAAAISLLAGVFGAAYPARAHPAAQDGLRVIIDQPASREVVSGVVTITGTATGPGFRQYRLEVAPDPSLADDWQPVQGAVGQQVQDGILGQWDTTGVADGAYILRLVVIYENGAQAADYEVRLSVVNATATALPAPTTATPTAEPGTPTPGPSPTPLIEQPPTRTPRPGAAGRADPPETGPRAPESPLARPRLVRAAWRGVLWALLAFALIATYTAARLAARGELGERVQGFRREIVTPVLNALRRGGKASGRRTR